MLLKASWKNALHKKRLEKLEFVYITWRRRVRNSGLFSSTFNLATESKTLSSRKDNFHVIHFLGKSCFTVFVFLSLSLFVISPSYATIIDWYVQSFAPSFEIQVQICWEHLQMFSISLPWRNFARLKVKGKYQQRQTWRRNKKAEKIGDWTYFNLEFWAIIASHNTIRSSTKQISIVRAPQEFWNLIFYTCTFLQP